MNHVVPFVRSSVLAWGNGTDGQLGFGSSELEAILAPRELSHFHLHQLSVQQIGVGQNHTLFVLTDGSLWSCGRNDFGQLGREHTSGSLRRPGKIEKLQHHNIVQAAAGASHSIAISDSGQLFTWGANDSGQCGRESGAEDLRIPKLVKHLARFRIIQVCAGDKFSVALSDEGRVYVWGDNTYGQLGLGHVLPVESPSIVNSLTGLPVKQIAAGAEHMIILSISGSAFAAGKNNLGQLGVGDNKERMHLSAIKSFKNQKICYVDCGAEFSVGLTVDGGVFTFGAGGNGQLGHGQAGNEVMPRKVFELMGSTVTQICCGRSHTMVYIMDSGKIYGFGLGSNGQLGTGKREGCSLPKICRGAWDIMQPSGVVLRELYAGGDQSFAVVALGSKPAPPIDFRLERPLITPLAFTTDNASRMTAALTKLEGEDALLDDAEMHELMMLCGCVCSWNSSFLEPSDLHYSTGSKVIGIDLEAAKDALGKLSEAFNSRTRELVLDEMKSFVLPELFPNPASIECLRIFFILPLFPIFASPLVPDRVLDYIAPLASALSSLSKEPDKLVRLWFSLVNISLFETYVQLYKQSLIAMLRMPEIEDLIQKERLWKGAQALLEALAILYDANNRLRVETKTALPYEVFYVAEITDKVNIALDYKNWYQSDPRLRSKALSFCNYPFTFDPRAKTLLLQADSALQMQNAVFSMDQFDIINSLMRAAANSHSTTINPQLSLFLNLYVSRDDLLKDTLDQIWSFKVGKSIFPDLDLKRPLKVWFKDEEAEDAGGVKKEFFMLLIRELLDPKYGMFTYYEETRAIYFNGNSFESKDRFSMVGIICGLAIYNGIIVDAHFPLVLYKKLLSIKPTLQGLDDLTPTVRRSMEQLLSYDKDDFEDTFDLNFTISVESFGETIVHPLKLNGANIAVTKENRGEFVDRYVDFVLNKAAEGQFSAFYEGFHRVCGGRILELFQPQELKAMVEGNENYDWNLLQEAAVYKGDFSADHPTIRLFWKVFRSLSLEQKKKFLLYLTGCDRIPILGMEAVKMVIQPMGAGDEFLPVAHTCFNMLDLPKYSDESALRKKLTAAIEHTQGFGLA